MTKHALPDRSRFKGSLTALVSVLITLAAVLPLLITIVISQALSRPQLIAQSADAMAQDAHARVQLIDTYLHDRLHDVQTVSNLYALQQYALGHRAFKQQALNALMVGAQNDVNYVTWSVLDLQGHALLWYPMYPRLHGNKLIPSDVLAQIQLSNSPQISGVYYDPQSGEASIVIAMPIIESTSTRVIGIVQAEINLTYIWNVVNTQVDQQGSYAFILDQNGVRIASTSPGSTLTRSTSLFRAIAPLSAAQWRNIVADDLYGNNERPVTVLSDPAIAAIQNAPNAPSRFEAVPAGQQERFEIARVPISVVGWTYFSLRPLHAIVSIADQQLRGTLLIAATVLILAIIIGIATGYYLTQPIQRSIEQQQRAYEQQQYLSEMKDQILLNVSHELRTPLTEVYGYLELMSLYNGQLDSETKKTFLGNAIEGCEELQLLVTTMLDTVRADTQPKTVFLQDTSVAQAVKDVLDLFSPRTLNHYKLEVNVPRTLTVRADPQYLRQILRNLLSNAFKYTPPQTLITVEATLIENPRPDKSPAVRICVKDSGPGIAPEEIPRLFEKFVRLKRDLSGATRGSGLGLYISKQLVEAMRGHIWVESSGVAGQGCRFCFTLPCASVSQESSSGC
jgi:signal transduction histidine kinase